MVNIAILILNQGEYHNTSLAHHGDRGSKLPALPTGTVWKAGGTAEVRVMMIIMMKMLTVMMMVMGICQPNMSFMGLKTKFCTGHLADHSQPWRWLPVSTLSYQ